MKLYKIACIGARKTPITKLLEIEELGKWLVENGFIISSGNATGADYSFVKGGNKIDSKKIQLFLPWENLNKEQIVEGNEIKIFGDKNQFDNELKTVHPQWEILKESVKKLHRRNYGIIENSLVIICWTEGGKDIGGTGVGIRLGIKKGIPIFNLYNCEIDEVKKFLKNLIEKEKSK